MTANLNQFESVDGASSLGKSDSRELIELARNGCDDALGELIRSLQGYLLLVANQEVGAELRIKVAPSDLVQNALVRAQQNLADFRGTSQKTLLAWLRKILVREVITARRKYLASEKRSIYREVATTTSRGVGTLLADPGHSPHSDAVLKEEARRLRAAVAKLSVDYRQVVVLRSWERLPFDEIGRRMDRSTDAVKKLWKRAIGRLEKELLDES